MHVVGRDQGEAARPTCRQAPGSAGGDGGVVEGGGHAGPRQLRLAADPAVHAGTLGDVDQGAQPAGVGVLGDLAG